MGAPTRAKILKTIITLKNHKSSGEDGLSPELYKKCPKVTAEQIHGILQDAWKTNSFPKDWRTSIILPFYKKGDKTECRNYRGISLIDITVKIFRIILLNRFKSAREKNTHENQAGFRPGRGCIDNIFGTRLIIQQFQRYNLPLPLIFPRLHRGLRLRYSSHALENPRNRWHACKVYWTYSGILLRVNKAG